MDTLRQIGGMLTAPRAALREVGLGEGTGLAALFASLALYLLVELVVVFKALYWSAILAQDQPVEALERLYDALVKNARNDLAVFAGAILLLWILGRVLKVRVSPLAAAALLLVPLCALKLVGVSLLALGVDQWWLPHHPVDSPVIVVERQVSWLRFVLKHVTAYGIGAVLMLLLVVDAKRAAAPKPFAKRGLAGAALLALLFVVSAAGAWADAAKNERWLRPAVPGDVVMNETLPWLGGLNRPAGRFELEQHRGKVVLLDFWASWCAPCRRAMPELSALHDELKGEGLVVIGVNRDQGRDGKAKAEQFLFELQPSFPSAWDNRHWGDALGLRSLPTSFVIDRRGVLRHLHLGYTPPDVYRAELRALLQEKP